MTTSLDGNYTMTTSELVTMTARTTVAVAEDFDIRKSQYIGVDCNTVLLN